MYEIKYAKNALKNLKKESKETIERILTKIEEKLQNFNYKTSEVKYLKKYNIYRLRIGAYRVGFSRKEKIIEILSIKRRNKAYK
jgi:mRNA-degrading endonuclease RelE of RelBE toxin-antitoxin system